MAATECNRRSRGRPRLFIPEQALDAAMKVFWQKGYEGTTLTDLTAATGLSRPSLYAAFGGKQSIYCRVLDRYVKGPSSYLRTAMDAPTAFETVERMLHGAIDMLSTPENPSICMIAQGTLACGEESEPIRQEAIARRQMGEAMLRKRLERAVSEGELPADTNAAKLALYYATVLRGIGISVLSGAGRKELYDIARMAMSIWPAAPVSPA